MKTSLVFDLIVSECRFFITTTFLDLQRPFDAYDQQEELQGVGEGEKRNPEFLHSFSPNFSPLV